MPSATLTAEERVDVYHGMYLLRMAEALESDYPALAHFLGPERWHGLVREYVAEHPSTSYTLNVLGRQLPDWLRGHGRLPARLFCRDLARLEWAVAESFDADEAPRLGAEAIEAVPADEWPRRPPRPEPGSSAGRARLERGRVARHREGRAPPPPEAATEGLVRRGVPPELRGVPARGEPPGLPPGVGPGGGPDGGTRDRGRAATPRGAGRRDSPGLVPAMGRRRALHRDRTRVRRLENVDSRSIARRIG